MIPVSALMALIAVISGLVRTSELTAFHALGYGLPSVLRTVIIFLLGLIFMLVWMGDVVLPFAAEKRNYIYYVEMKKRPDKYAMTKTKNIWYRTKNAIIHFDTILDDNNINGVHIYYVNTNWKLVRMIEAKNLKLSKSVWELSGVRNSMVSGDQSSFVVSEEKSLEIPALTELESMKMSGEATDSLGIIELISLIKKNEEIYLDTNQLKVTLYSKFSFALTALILPLLGLCTVSTHRRSANMFLSGGIAVGLVFLYWVVYNGALSMGKAGVLNPALAALMVPIVVLVVIGFAIRRVLN